MSELLRTPLHDRHVAAGGHMVDFAGWSMPVRYGSIVDEHVAVRTACGLFDIGHMGRLRFEGPRVAEVLGGLVTCAVGSMAIGRVRYGLVCDESGGILDDVLIDRVAADVFGVVVNASNHAKVVRHFESFLAEQGDVTLVDETERTGMIAVQGPAASGVIEAVCCSDVIGGLGYYRAVTAGLDGVEVRLSRTGYTGDDGFEIVCEAEAAVAICDRLLATPVGDVATGPTPCGLGARDTLRLEAAMPLYGHELSELIDPVTAGLGFAVSFDEPFVGAEAVAKVGREGPGRTRVGIVLDGRRPAREGATVYVGEEPLGTVTSGGPSPTLGRPIAMAYVAAGSVVPGDAVEVDVRGRREAGSVVELPFYRRKK